MGLQSRANIRGTKMAHRTACAFSIIATALLLGNGAAHAQYAVTAVTAANDAFYAAESALDVPSMEKVRAHEEYVALAGPRSTAPLIGWTALQSYFARSFGNMAQFR